SVCPAGVRYGEMLEFMRHETNRAPREPFALRALVPHPRRLRATFAMLRFMQRTGLVAMGRSLGLPRRFFGPAVGALEPELPPVAPASLRAPIPRRTAAVGTTRGRVALLEGCLASQMFGAVNRATVRVLARVGFEVIAPEKQGCCGALHLHQGFLEHGRDLARHTIENFERTGADVYVVNSAGCGSAMKEYVHLLADEPAWAPRAAEFSKRVRDVSELLASIELPPMPHRVSRRVAYHDACHLAHGQKIVREPRQLLRRIPGVELVALRDSDQCCGSAGIYNVVEYESAMQVLERKIDCIAEAKPDVVAAGNPGCLLQIVVGAKRRGLRIEVVHPIELVDRAYHGDPPSA
ncbi:MAG: (Fe-S)-binding protein, partial [Planctomycetes bacterium]|nr:(Fe-S)-binding protein [Planctomycetota bacterium]